MDTIIKDYALHVLLPGQSLQNEQHLISADSWLGLIPINMPNVQRNHELRQTKLEATDVR